MSHRFSFGLFLLVLSIVVVVGASNAKIGKIRTEVFADEVRAATPRSETKKRRIVVIGSHPGDPENGCGGLIARLTRGGHEVIVAYAACFRRDRKVGDETEAVVNHRESEAACKLLTVTPYFFDYTNEELMADESRLNAVSSWIKQMQPDIVVTHWPVDASPNHHVTSSLVWQSYLRDKKWSLYFFEVLNDRQTIAFKPDLFLDIADVRDLKKDACFCFQSQSPQGFWVDHEDLHRLRGEECGVRYAEAYILAEPLPGRAVLPVSFLKKKN